MAPARGGSLRATAIQLFTKTPNQWRERVLVPEQIERFRHEVARHRLEAVVSHDSYLINLASPDPVLSARSIESFKSELVRSEEHTSELQSRQYLVCRLLLEKKNKSIQHRHRRSSVQVVIPC